MLANNDPIGSRKRAWNFWRFCILVFCAANGLMGARAFADECRDANPNARRATPSDGFYDYVSKNYPDACVIQDFDRRSATDLDMDYYTRSKSRCESLPGFVRWTKDSGSGYNLCVFKPAGGTSSPSTGGSRACDSPWKEAPAWPQFIDALGRSDWMATSVHAGEIATFLSGYPESCRQATVGARIYTCNSVAARVLAQGDDRSALALRGELEASCNRSNVTSYVVRAFARIDGAVMPAAPPPDERPAVAVDPSPAGDDRFVAIAVTPTATSTASEEGRTEAQARSAAQDLCMTRQRNTITTGYDTLKPCNVAVSSRNGCVALAIDGEAMWATNSVATRREDSEFEALVRCQERSVKKCKIAISRCAKPEPERGDDGALYLAFAATGNGSSTGSSNNSRTQFAAQWEAINNCRARQDNTISTGYDTRQFCKITTWAKNACIAWAQGRNGWGTDWGNSHNEARQKARLSCQARGDSCTASWSQCASTAANR